MLLGPFDSYIFVQKTKNNMNFKALAFLSILLIILITKNAFTQTDSIVFNNNNYIVGEIKDLKQGIIKIETDYSDSDFAVEWDKIKYVKSEQIFLITMSKGDRYNGSIETVDGDRSKIIVQDLSEGNVTVDMMDIVFLKAVKQNFISRLDILLSIGYTQTKANNNRQFSGKTEIGYLSNTIGFNANFDMVRSFQEETQDTTTVKIATKRTEGGAGFRAFIIRDWFALINTNLLQSTEMQLDLRAVTKGGFGNYLVNNQQMYFVAAAGAAWNYEDYTNPGSTQTNPRSSVEAFLGLEYKIFDIGDLKLNTSVYGYPSLTESGRFRTDFNFDLRYEFTFDLFFGIGFTWNFDNKPAPGSTTTDYVFQTSVGWEL
jgi:hypothetical protein